MKKTIEIGQMIIIILLINIKLIHLEFNNYTKVMDKIINGKKDNKDNQMKITLEEVNLIDLRSLIVSEKLVV